MRFTTLAAAVAVVMAAAPVAAESTNTRTHHATVAKRPGTHVTVTRRSYLDPGTEVLPQAHASQYLYSLGFMKHNPNYSNPADEVGAQFYPLSDPFWPQWH
jgi:hypothetical protein